MKAFTTIYDSKTGTYTRLDNLPDYVRDEDIGITGNALTVMKSRYIRKDKDGNPIETVAGMFYRIALIVANGEGAEVVEKFYKLMSEIRFFPNTPTFLGAGTPLKNLAACYVLPVDDEMGRGEDGIFNTLRNAALIQQTGGGVGFSFGRIRPKGAIVSRSNGKATGPIGFLETYNKAFDVIAQGGCFIGDTLVAVKGGMKKIKDVVDGDLVLSLNADGYFELKETTGAWKTKENAEVWELYTDSAISVYATPDHLFMTEDAEYVELRNLKEGDQLRKFNDIRTQFDRVRYVNPSRSEDVYDIEVPETHNFVVCNTDGFGLVVHNSRRSANMGVMPVHHPDIREFITCKAKEGDIANFNISVAITDDFMAALEKDTKYPLISPVDNTVVKWESAKEIFDLIVEYAHRNGEPGVLFIDEMNRYNPVPHLYTLEATNPCFAPDTLIQTKIGHYRIKDLVGKIVDVWDGKSWVTIDNFRVTGRNQRMVKIVMTGGEEINVTKYHKMLLANGKEVLASEVKAGDKLMLSGAPLTHGIKKTSGAYLKGFLLGDGTNSTSGERPELWLYGNKRQCAERLMESLRGVEQKAFRTNVVSEVMVKEGHYSGGRDVLVLKGMTPAKDELYPWATHYKHGLPSEVFEWDLETKSEFIAGLFDADGTSFDTPTSMGYQMSSIHKEFLMDVKSLLSTMGVGSSLSIMKEAAKKDFNDGYGEYESKRCWRLSLTKSSSIDLAKQVKFSRLKDFSDKKLSYSIESRKNIVKEVQDGGIEEEVYCCTVPTTHFVALSSQIITGQCGEQALGPYENCCLGSINLVKHINPETASVDWDLLRKTIETATHFLDNVVTVNQYVPEVPQLKQAADRARRIGLGIMGMADALIMLGYSYASQRGRDIASSIMEYVTYHSMNKSVDLASERGVFEAYKGSIYDPETFKFERPTHDNPSYPFSPFMDWDKLITDVKQFGIRNAANTTIAPTGTISTVAMVEGYGCEPIFALGYVRHFMDGETKKELPYTSPLLNTELANCVRIGMFDQSTADRIKEWAARYGSVKDCPDAPKNIKLAFVVAGDISPEDHVLMQAALQRYCSNSISKTINFPEGATRDDVAKVYKLAHKLGCRGLTVYVTGSREQVVLETADTKAKKQQAQTDKVQEIQPVKRQRPSKLTGSTFKKSTPAGVAYVTVNSDESNQPFEVFLNVGKAGSEISAISEALGRLISLALRMPAHTSPKERLDWVKSELQGIGGSRPFGFGKNRVLSLPDGVAKVIDEYLKPNGNIIAKDDSVVYNEETKQSGDICPECGEASFLNIEGCRKCHQCGYSEC